MKVFVAILLITPAALFAQVDKSDYYFDIPPNPPSFSAGTVASRMVDGLGFRYYWATEGLTEENLAFQPGSDARTLEETVDHIANLVHILNSAVNVEKISPISLEEMSFAEKRYFTLDQLRQASERLSNSSDEELATYDMVFSESTRYPFWNMLNGPIADALTHVGQIVSFRRASGNPINPNISVLRGEGSR